MSDNVTVAVRQKGCSKEQQTVEAFVIERFSEELSKRFPERVILKPETVDGIKLDGYSANPPIACECYARQGALKAGNRHKVCADALRLIYVRKKARPEMKLFLLFCDKVAMASFMVGWRAEVIEAFGIEPRVVEISEEFKKKISVAQTRQSR